MSATATATTPARRGRPPVKDRAPDGMPARVRLLWVSSLSSVNLKTGATIPAGDQCELFSSEAAALRLVAAWSRCECMPLGLRIERKTPAGWVDA